MRVLLDEQLPRRLSRLLVGHDVRTVQSEGWAGLRNGDLLKRAIDAGFDAFLSSDRNIEFQLSVSVLPIRIVILRTASIRLEELKPLIGSMLQALEQCHPGQLMLVP